MFSPNLYLNFPTIDNDEYFCYTEFSLHDRGHTGQCVTLYMKT